MRQRRTGELQLWGDPVRCRSWTPSRPTRSSILLVILLIIVLIISTVEVDAKNSELNARTIEF